MAMEMELAVGEAWAVEPAMEAIAEDIMLVPQIVMQEEKKVVNGHWIEENVTVMVHQECILIQLHLCQEHSSHIWM